MADDFASLAEHSHKMAESLERGQKAASGIHFSIVQLATYAIGFEAIKHGFMAAIEQTQVLQKLTKVFSSDTSHLIDLRKTEAVFDGMISATQFNYNRKRSAARKEEEGQMLATYKAGREHVKAQIQASELWQNHSKLNLLGLAALAGMTGDLILKESQLNQNLIEANSSWASRGELMRKTLVTQTDLGASFGQITQSARALVHYGMDTESTFAENLRIVSEMDQGLGVSVDTAAQLASVVERQLKGSFSGVADVVAQLVNDTSLAGNEAAKLATTLANVMGRLRPGLGAAGLPEVLKLVGRYEGALKEVGGVPGTVEDMIAKLTTPEGLTGAGILGVQPEFVATQQGVQQVMDRFAAYGKSLVGQSQGMDRQFRLNTLGELFNMSALQANQLMLAIDRANHQQVGTISLQDRWNEQMHATNAGISRIVESLKGLFQQVMYTVVPAFSWMVNSLADVVQWAVKSRVAVYAAGVVLFGGAILATRGLWTLAKALVYVAYTAQMAANRTAALATSQLGSSLLPKGPMLAAFWKNLTTLKVVGGAGATWKYLPTLETGLKGIGGYLKMAGPLLGRLLLGVGPLAIIAGGVGYLGSISMQIYQTNKKSLEEQLASRRIEFSQKQTLVDRAQARVYREARYGDAAGQEQAMKHLYSLASTLFRDEDPKVRMAKMRQWIEEQKVVVGDKIVRGIYTSGMFQTVQQRGKPQVAKDQEQLDLLKKNGTIADKQLEIARKRLQQADQINSDIEIQDAKLNSELNSRDAHHRFSYGLY